jgi:hypothetical protein
MQASVVGDELVATLDAYDEADNFDSGLKSSLSVRLMGKDDKQPSNAIVPFELVAPGLYQARAALADFGAYAVKAVHRRVTPEGESVPAGVSFASVTRPYPEEFRDLTPRPEVLEDWARAGGGTYEPEPAAFWQPGDDRVKTRVGRQNDFIVLAVIFFLLDLLVRRVRLFDRDFRRG